MAENKATTSDQPDLKIAVCQFAAVSDNAANIAHISELTAQSAAQGARLVVFPEASSYAFSSTGEELARAAREDKGGFQDAMCRIAREHGMEMVVGMYQDSGQPLSDNVMLHVRADGSVGDTYHKLHLYDAFTFKESEKNTSAPLKDEFDELTVFDIGPFRFGLVNCYDLRFPEVSRALIDLGANVLVVSAGWVAGPLKEFHWETLLKARAIENTSYVLGSSQPAPLSAGLSMVVDPTGHVLGTVPHGEGIAVATLSKRHLDEFRAILPCLEHRRYRVVAAR